MKTCKPFTVFTQHVIPSKENTLPLLGVTDFIEVDSVIQTPANLNIHQ